LVHIESDAMDALEYLPQLPLPASPLVLFGVLLLTGLVGGEVARRFLKLPRITGYVAVGMALGGSGLGWLEGEVLAESRVFVDIALGLILFELGRRLDLRWLLHNPWLLLTAVVESGASFALVCWTLTYLGISPFTAAVAAAIGISTAPSVVLVMAQDLGAEGQVTGRTISLSALNSLLAFLAVTMLLSFLRLEYQAGWLDAVFHPFYLLVGSTLLGYAATAAAVWLARWLGKQHERQLVMQIALILVTIGAATALELSVLLALLAFGVMAKNLDRDHHLMVVETGQAGQLFFVVLFVVNGARLVPGSLAAAGSLALLYIGARFVGKSLGVLAFSQFSGLRLKSAALLCLCLTPMSELATLMVGQAAAVWPEAETDLATLMMAVLVILELAGPVAVQVGFRRAGEARPGTS
jgi:Kef-type K+ transport system membrane component KefB